MQRVLRLRACRAASTTQHVLRARVPEGKRTVEKHERVIQLLNLPRAHVVHHRSNPFLSSRIFFHLSPPRGRARPEEMSQLPFGFNILHPRSSAPSFVPQATPPSMGSDWSSPMGYPQSPGMQVSMPAINTDSFASQLHTRKPASLWSARAEVVCCRRKASSRRMEAIRFLLVCKIRHIRFSWSSMRRCRCRSADLHNRCWCSTCLSGRSKSKGKREYNPLVPSNGNRFSTNSLPHHARRDRVSWKFSSKFRSKSKRF